MADMTKDQAREALANKVAGLYDLQDIPDLDKFDTAWNMLDAVLSAPHEVLAAALGGWVKRHKNLEGRTLIVLPPQEVGE